MSDIAVTTRTAETAGSLLRFWRQRRRLSQQALALEANLSTRHLSFIETGRAQPSRQLLVHLSDTLAIPLRERNRLLLAGGFAPRYRELPFDEREMRLLLDSLQTLLRAHEPNPALIVDAHWNLIAHNHAATLLRSGVDPGLLEPPVNVLRLACHPGGLPKISTMTPVQPRTARPPSPPRPRRRRPTTPRPHRRDGQPPDRYPRHRTTGTDEVDSATSPREGRRSANREGEAVTPLLAAVTPCVARLPKRESGCSRAGWHRRRSRASSGPELRLAATALPLSERPGAVAPGTTLVPEPLRKLQCAR